MQKKKRIEREKITVVTMIRLYCRSKHNTEGVLCDNCRDLNDYALKRLDHCRFGIDKPFCVDCPVHCYKPAMREKIREVMRFSGPKMLLYHPVIAIRHLLRKKSLIQFSDRLNTPAESPEK